MRVGINGFGRIGRLSFRAIRQREVDIQVVGVNDLTDLEASAHLLKYDSNYGGLAYSVNTGDGHLVVEGVPIPFLSERDWDRLPWADLGAEVVIEATGVGTEREAAAKHLEAGAKKVLVCAPGKQLDATVVLGVNHETYDPARHQVISNASCTTNALAPPLDVVHREFGVRKGMMSTVHAYTSSQSLVDGPAKDLRDARAASLSIVPAKTGAAKAIGEVIPELNGRFHGAAYRVPVPTVSVVEFVVSLECAVTADEINGALKSAASGRLKGILDVADDPLVSMDLKGNTHSSIVDSGSTLVVADDLAKVVAWYDNEWGYACRVADVTALIAESLVEGA